MPRKKEPSELDNWPLPWRIGFRVVTLTFGWGLVGLVAVGIYDAAR
jgi:hypothetical protein